MATMAKTLICLVVGFVLITGYARVVVSNDIDSVMQIVDLDASKSAHVVSRASATAAEGVQTTASAWFGWGLPYPWWPQNFCFWDNWTTAAWQVTLTGSVRCSLQ